MSQIATQPSETEAFTPGDIRSMALAVMRLHGPKAPKVAGYLAHIHLRHGDAGRAKAWRAVAVAVKDWPVCAGIGPAMLQ